MREEFELELENRIKNLIWTVSGDYTLDVKPDIESYHRSHAVGLYDGIKQEFKDQMKFITSISVPVSWRRQYCGIFEAKANGVIYYFLDNQYYFKRDGIYGHYDDAERFAFFARAVLEIIPAIDWKPDIIHCNDWQSALTPLYYSCYYANNQNRFHYPQYSISGQIRRRTS